MSTTRRIGRPVHHTSAILSFSVRVRRRVLARVWREGVDATGSRGSDRPNPGHRGTHPHPPVAPHLFWNGLKPIVR